MAVVPPDPSTRLDSWKAIAAYLRRDVRTVMRWAKVQGLPVRRVPGGRGRSVFAFSEEIDAWLKGPRGAGTALAVDTPEPAAAAPPALERARPPAGAAWITAALLATVLAWVAVTAVADVRNGSPFHIAVDRQGVYRVDVNGRRAIHSFDPRSGLMPVPRANGELVTDLDADGEDDVLIGVSYGHRPDDQVIETGRLLRLTTRGQLRWSYEFTDTVSFGEQSYSPPWALTDWQASPGGGRRRIAVTAHHYTWWPSIVAMLDDGGSRVGTFVNAGWVEGVRWLDADRVAIAGFSNARNGGMLAVLDARRFGGRSPGADPAFACSDCPPGEPLEYLVFPRSELNLLTDGRFNRAAFQMRGDTLVVTTAEISTPAETVGAAIYEFAPDFSLRRATYSDGYWETHRRLEAEGRIGHAVESCSTRAGPARYESWSAARGWEVVPVRAPHAAPARAGSEP